MSQPQVVFDHGVFGNKHNRLFRPGPNGALNACVGKNGGPADFDRYSSGGFEAGRRLTESLRNDPWGVDRVIYPLVMVYRQGIETGLKHLMTVLPPLCDETAKPKATHFILDNWKPVRRYLIRLEGDSAVLDRIEQTLQDFVEIDPRGENFRYPEDRRGNRVLQDTSLINVEVLAEEMAFVGQFLEGCSLWAEELLQAKWEAEWVALEEQRAFDREMADYHGYEYVSET